MDKIGFESNFSYPHELDCSQSQANRHPQWTQYLEIARVQCSKKRYWKLYVPNKYATDDTTGLNKIYILYNKLTKKYLPS